MDRSPQKHGWWGLLLAAVLFAAAAPAGQALATWGDIAAEMEKCLQDAHGKYASGDVEGGKKRVNDAYFQYYEKLGFERTVLSYISGRRASEVEYKFAAVKRAMTEGKSLVVVRNELDALAKMLRDDADRLDGKEESPTGTFIASLLILTREGFEAILVIAAIAAYLVRSGNQDRVGLVYWSGGAAVVASGILAIALQTLFEMSGANQEILEGVAMLTAVVVLFFVSNWMLSKAGGQAWKNYIDGKVRAAVAGGSAFALGSAAFLAVFREGAETILFYQALLAETETTHNMIWAGMGVAAVILVVLFALVRYGSLVIPIRPFFIGTSILLYLMAISFAGGGVKELQEADVVAATPVSYIGTVDILGIYPTMETLAPQILLIAATVVSAFFALRQSSARPEGDANPA
jgi:high-affinity iron transporter